MSVNEAPSPATKAWLSLGVKILITAFVIGIGALHIVGDAVWHSSSVAAKADTMGSNKYGD
jgi:type IV secretory pathway TrbL component